VDTFLACENLDATDQELTGRGVEFTNAPEDQPWGRFAIFKDRDGNNFLLSSAT